MGLTESQYDAIAARLKEQRGELPQDEAYTHEVLRCMVDAGACRIGMQHGKPLVGGLRALDLAPNLAQSIDHTALGPKVTEAGIRRLCKEAAQHGFAAVCVPPCYVALAFTLLKGSPVRVATVVGFPHGSTHPAVKAAEAAQAVRDGATEIDMVQNIGWLKSSQYDRVEEDVRATVRAAKGINSSALVKVILECTLLTDEEKVIACILAQNGGADFVKTSTGFAQGGATLEDVELMRKAVGRKLGIKASGGIKTREQAERLLEHGATRIGASASIAIVGA